MSFLYLITIVVIFAILVGVTIYPQGRFDIDTIGDRLVVLNQIAEKRKLVDSVGQNDLLRAEAVFLKEFKDGLLGKITLEKYGA